MVNGFLLRWCFIVNLFTYEHGQHSRLCSSRPLVFQCSRPLDLCSFYPVLCSSTLWVLLSPGPLFLWPSFPLVLCSCGPPFLWPSGPLFLWSSIRLVPWSSGPPFLWFPGPLFVQSSGPLFLNSSFLPFFWSSVPSFVHSYVPPFLWSSSPHVLLSSSTITLSSTSAPPAPAASTAPALSCFQWGSAGFSSDTQTQDSWERFTIDNSVAGQIFKKKHRLFQVFDKQSDSLWCTSCTGLFKLKRGIIPFFFFDCVCIATSVGVFSLGSRCRSRHRPVIHIQSKPSFFWGVFQKYKDYNSICSSVWVKDYQTMSWCNIKDENNRKSTQNVPQQYENAMFREMSLWCHFLFLLWLPVKSLCFNGEKF